MIMFINVWNRMWTMFNTGENEGEDEWGAQCPTVGHCWQVTGRV